jgi:hypothetical protein
MVLCCKNLLFAQHVSGTSMSIIRSIMQVIAACGTWSFGLQVVGLVWSCRLCVRFAGCCSIPQTGHLTDVPPWSCSTAVYKPVWHISPLSVQWINSWWWTEELSKTCRVSCQNIICEINASSWFYYKEISLKISGTLSPKYYDIL